MTSFVLQILTGDAVEVQLNFLRRAGGDQAIKDLEVELIKALQTHIYTKEELDKMFQTDTSKVLLNIGHNPPEGYFLLRDKDLNTDEYIYSLEDKEQYLADYGITL